MRPNSRLVQRGRRLAGVFRIFSTGPAIFLASILIVVLFWSVLPAQFRINEDADYVQYYEPVARNIVEGRGITLGEGLAVQRPPGHPVFIAGLFRIAELFRVPEALVISIVILICTGLSSLFLFILARQIWGSLPAVISALVWTTYPLALWFTKQPNSEVPFLVFLYGAFALLWYALFRKDRAGFFYFGSGLLIGGAMLIRPIALGIGLLMGVIIWIMKRDESMRLRWAFITAVLLGNFVAVLPWELWVYAKSERVILLTRSGAPNMDDGLVFAILGSQPPSGAPNDVVELMRDIAAQGNRTRSLSGVITVVAEELRDRPAATLKLIALKIARSWYGTDSRRFEFQIMLLQIPYLALILWSSRRAWKLGGAMRNTVIGIWLVVLYFWALTFVALPLVRYMVPVIGLLFVLIPASFPIMARHRALHP